MSPVELVVIGCSAGGLVALRHVLAPLKADTSPPVVVVQHRSRDSEALAEILASGLSVPVMDAEDKQTIRPGSVYLAPPDYHLLIDDGHFTLSLDPPVRFSRPSIDVLFSAVADAYGARAMGVVLTGANEDGARGLARLARRGARTVVQDPSTAESSTMPRAALAAVPSATVLDLDALAALLGGLEPAATQGGGV